MKKENIKAFGRSFGCTEFCDFVNLPNSVFFKLKNTNDWTAQQTSDYISSYCVKDEDGFLHYRNTDVGRCVEYGDKVYKSISALCRDLDINHSLFCKLRRADNLSVQEAVDATQAVEKGSFYLKTDAGIFLNVVSFYSAYGVPKDSQKRYGWNTEGAKKAYQYILSCRGDSALPIRVLLIERDTLDMLQAKGMYIQWDLMKILCKQNGAANGIPVKIADQLRMQLGYSKRDDKLLDIFCPTEKLQNCTTKEWFTLVNARELFTDTEMYLVKRFLDAGLVSDREALLCCGNKLKNGA